jgi:hypothetical protein
LLEEVLEVVLDKVLMSAEMSHRMLEELVEKSHWLCSFGSDWVRRIPIPDNSGVFECCLEHR